MTGLNDSLDQACSTHGLMFLQFSLVITCDQFLSNVWEAEKFVVGANII